MSLPLFPSLYLSLSLPFLFVRLCDGCCDSFRRHRLERGIILNKLRVKNLKYSTWKMHRHVCDMKGHADLRIVGDRKTPGQDNSNTQTDTKI